MSTHAPGSPYLNAQSLASICHRIGKDPSEGFPAGPDHNVIQHDLASARVNSAGVFIGGIDPPFLTREEILDRLDGHYRRFRRLAAVVAAAAMIMVIAMTVTMPLPL